LVSITGIESFKMMALWSRTWTEATSGQDAGEKPRLPHTGPRATDLDGHAVEREENMLESRSMDSEEFRSRTRAGTYSRQSLVHCNSSTFRAKAQSPNPLLKILFRAGVSRFSRARSDPARCWALR